ncbi:cyclic peptide export ABC transporter, partial [Burkholderia multivorans]
MTAAHEPTSPPSPDAAPARPATRLILALLRESRASFALALVACVLNGIASVLLVAT